MKHLLTLALVLCLGTFASAQIPSYVPTNGLVGWWPFNGNANDESGNGNHGTVNGATLAADRFGNAGKAYSFDGVNDWIDFPVVIDSPTTAISLWFNTNSTSFQSVVDNDIGGFYGNNLILNYGNSYPNKIVLLFHDGVFSSSLFTFSTNTTYHFVGIWNDNYCKFYINGNLVGSFSHPKGINEKGAYRIGKHSGNSGFYSGIIDNLAIYNRALSSNEIQNLFLSCTSRITAQPQNKSVAQGQTTTFAVQVDTTATFQWQMNLGLGAGWVNIPQSALFSGDTTSMLSVQGRSTIDGAQFRCIAAACQSDTSIAATLTVTSNPSTLGSVAGVPGKINYQGAAVDSLGKPMKNQTIALKLSVLDSSSSGAAAYVESHSTPTNGSGMFSLKIGGGTAVSGTFDSIPWANGRNKYLKTELNQNGTWINLGTSQLVSVPYALHAGSAENAKNATNATFANQAATLRDSLGNAYQIKTVNGQPTLVSAPGNVSTPGTFACGQAVTYAGESYPTVQIGTQCWFAKNLNVGSMITGTSDQMNNSTLEKYCYNNDPANCSTYGGLYQWAEAVQYQNGASNTASPSPAFSGNIKGICPTGWHLPSDAEYCTLTTFLDASANCSVIGTSSSIAGGLLKSTSGLWTSPNTGATNSSGFSALPGGYRGTSSSFNYIGVDTGFWSSSESSSTNAVIRSVGYDLSGIGRGNDGKDYGFSARCTQD